MNKIYILALMLLMGQSSWAQIREFQTTRLNSTGGAGVASMLSTEAGILNPAASAFLTVPVYLIRDTPRHYAMKTKPERLQMTTFLTQTAHKVFSWPTMTLH